MRTSPGGGGGANCAVPQRSVVETWQASGFWSGAFESSSVPLARFRAQRAVQSALAVRAGGRRTAARCQHHHGALEHVREGDGEGDEAAGGPAQWDLR